ncbi:MAG: type 4a pilus biogenesis protein PilO [Bdellovibrionales bacterium]|nr:type 4a pilus biogenesis protein PilO [Bdellovibrionales bacterium]
MIERLKSFPFMLIFMGYFFYVAYVVYEFNFMADGQVSQHQAQMSSMNADIDGLKKKLAEGQKFLKSLEVKKADLQAQVRKLSEYQGALSEAPDVPNLIKTLISEAKVIGLKVSKIEPAKRTQKEYYLEQEFKVEVRGTFNQVALFTQRVSKLQRILRIESFSMRPSAAATPGSLAPIVGDLSVRAYQYTLSKEDTIGKTTENIKTSGQAPGGKR